MREYRINTWSCSHHRIRRLLLACVFGVVVAFNDKADAHSLFRGDVGPWAAFRGGATSSSTLKRKRRTEDSSSDAYRLLAMTVKDRLVLEDGDTTPDLGKVEKALASLSSAQGALKSLDGAAHEAYQRTHRKSGEAVDTTVSGRARRSAARAGCAADALLAAELCELVDNPDLMNQDSTNSLNGTLVGRQVVVNATTLKTEGMELTVLVLYEPLYSGGTGLDHGGIDDLLSTKDEASPPHGRFLVVVGDSMTGDLPRTIAVLDKPPLLVGLHTGLVANEVASVQGSLYRAAGQLLEQVLQPTLQSYNNSDAAIHFVGRSLAGGVASLAAIILDGSLPLPVDQSTKRRKRKRRRTSAKSGTEDESIADIIEPAEDGGKNETSFSLEGYGQGRSSAVVLGAPPCLSANIKAAFVTSIIYGDDVVCRATNDSLDRLCQRIQRTLKGGILGRRVGWMADTVSLTISSLKTHAHGSEGEEARLVVPGEVYLVRPRRLGGASSMHEVGGLKGGREALRAAVLWQLHDILLSRSLWRHHDLESYIQGLDRVQLRGLDEDGDMAQDGLY